MKHVRVIASNERSSTAKNRLQIRIQHADLTHRDFLIADGLLGGQTKEERVSVDDKEISLVYAFWNETVRFKTIRRGIVLDGTPMNLAFISWHAVPLGDDGEKFDCVKGYVGEDK